MDLFISVSFGGAHMLCRYFWLLQSFMIFWLILSLLNNLNFTIELFINLTNMSSCLGLVGIFILQLRLVMSRAIPLVVRPLWRRKWRASTTTNSFYSCRGPRATPVGRTSVATSWGKKCHVPTTTSRLHLLTSTALWRISRRPRSTGGMCVFLTRQ